MRSSWTELAGVRYSEPSVIVGDRVFEVVPDHREFSSTEACVPAQLTTRAQVNGYRFLLKRYEHALVRRDVRMLHDPMRSHVRSLVVGAVLGILVVAGAAIMAFLRPQGAVGDAKIVMAKDSGALYVVVGDTLHPVLNLASARLISGSTASPSTVKDSKLTMPRGPLLGIPGAPAALPGSADGDRAVWTLCDKVPLSASGTAAGARGVSTTVIAGALDDSAGNARPIGADRAALVTHAGKTYLAYDGKRAELDPKDSVLIRSLGLAGRTAAPVGSALLNSLEPVPPLAAPRIDRLGEPGPGKLAEIPVGGLIRVRGVGAEELYVVLADGVQSVSPFAAEVIRNANSQDMDDIRTVPPDRIVGVPVVAGLPIQSFPGPIPTLLSADEDPVTCVSWSRGKDDASAAVTMLAGRELPLPDGVNPAVPASADGSGDRIDAVYVKPSSGEFVRSIGMTPGAMASGPLFYLADTGIRYGIPDAATAQILGLNDPKPMPKPIIEALTPGPTLSRQDALMSHDSLPQCPDSGAQAATCAQQVAAPAK
ncbi:type VII secretion protein EccB [Nocardia takedensis]|uniref:type VII secretion protein EccB n=1 Tax=Nocardia takedensis TaxID=259390 RepID=UPI003F76E54B